MEGRLKISKRKLGHFFETVKTKSNLSWGELSEQCGVSARTLQNWRKAKYTPSYKAIKFLSNKFSVSMPISENLGQYWYITKRSCRKGAFARQERHGILGDLESRRRGGIISQNNRRKNPERYLRMGCNVRKSVKPMKRSIALAELCGVLLGDGGITYNQVRVTLNKKDDGQYAKFVSRLMTSVMGERPSTKMRANTLTLTLSGIGFVEELKKVGLKPGNKVAQQVAIPSWILKNVRYSKVCVRGLIDTDGGVYFHRHTIHGKQYLHFGLCFTNASKPILKAVNKTLIENGFFPSVAQGRRIYIYNFQEVKRYFSLFGSSNQKHWSRLNTYLKSRKK